MKLHITMALVAFATLAPLRAQTVSFPQGDFEGTRSTQWTPDATGIGNNVSFPSNSGNNVARVGLVAVGGGSLKSSVGQPFVANSLYEVSVDIASSTLVGTALNLGMEIRDGNDVVVAELSQDQLLNVLGISLPSLTSLTTDLNLLDGALTDNLLLTGTLRDLLGSLLDGSGTLTDPALFGSLQGLIESLVGVDNSLLTRVTTLLENALGGNIVDSLGSPLDLADLTNGSTGLNLIADILSLNLLVPGDNQLADDVQDTLVFLLAGGNDGPVENLVALLTGLLGNPGDMDLVSNLLGTLFGEQDLISGVTNILNLSLIDGDLLGTLTGGDLTSLLGILTASGTAQNVKLLFTTGAVVPTGNLTVNLHASTSLIAVASVEFDNVSLRRFNLVPTPNPPKDPKDPKDPNDPNNQFTTRPDISPKQPRVIRHVSGPRVVIKGRATAYGVGNSIQKVSAKIKGKGTTAKDRMFKTVKGTENWTASVRVPVSSRTRVIFVAQDAKGLMSRQQHVRVSRN